ncbi:Putative 3-beta hydroxysteroid dehydrogenase/isomerase, NAD(P)-binding domain superfamily [Septoria linicola]|uniref:3-beta hydroxysteroid dehydrogenase/isomerase, NAD(P)-binding domain superfamily n=1 Tax=Septoria linicola TaxID=215465 RepID=A0A9Q9EFQ2_9PEZI|nr:Putative 3-beta hydroxysteroid dehydrogenase/isomerase, NAD(P)-binding domain superfamily [Septoria linicola]
MASSLVLLTGATGFIGFRILIELLQQGYSVRAAVRSAAKGQWLASRLHAVLQGVEFEHKVQFTIVPDFVQPDAFENAVKDACFIIHVASPITSSDNPEDWERDFKQVAIKGTAGLLESAYKSPSVRRIVVTSSMVALFSQKALFAEPSEAPLSANSRIPGMEPPYAHKMLAYQAGKIASLERAEAWVDERKPSFDIIHMHPSFVTGRDDLATTRGDLRKFSSNWHSMQIVLGNNNTIGKPLLTCHNDDVARCHVLALGSHVAGNQSFLISCSPEDGSEWDDVKKFVQRDFPDAVAAGILANNGTMPTVNKGVRFDVKKTEETFQFKHVPYEAQVLDVIRQYLELPEEERITTEMTRPTAKSSDWVRALLRLWRGFFSMLRIL